MSPFEKHPQWPAVDKIHHTLVAKGYRALVAGGAVRDLLLGHTPNDIDIATNATPDQVGELFDKTVMVGKEFGVCRVVMEGVEIEVATFRKDGPYEDGRRPSSVEFSSDKEDALRRDFTINAMFYDLDKNEVIDYVGGQKDLMKKVIRTVGQPVARFEEDKLRILRALRFLSQLGFEIDRDTQEAMQLWKHKLDQVSMERVRDEWGKLLLGEHRLKALELSDKLKIFSVLFPQWTFMPLQYRSLLSDKAYEPSVLWAMWMLIHLKERQSIAEEGLRWKLSRDLIKDIIFCYDQMTHIREFANRDAADFAIFMGTTRGKFAVKVYRNINRPQAERWKSKFKEASQYFVDGKLPKPVVNGDDLIQYGMQPGPMVSEMLHRIYYKQLKEGISHKEELMKILAEEEN